MARNEEENVRDGVAGEGDDVTGRGGGVREATLRKKAGTRVKPQPYK